MKEAIGGSWLYTLVIVMIALFTTFVSVTTNYTRAYKIKDQLISIIERNKGVTTDTLTQINSYLNSLGYTSTGVCPSAKYHGFSRVDNNGTSESYADQANYCIYKRVITCRAKTVGNEVITFSGQNGYNTIPRAYYGVVAFFRLDWPILRQVIHLELSGETSIIYLVNENREITEFKNEDVCTS
ncbi:MAG: hypothetical protein II625_05080 [Bacilli bacterium]|nr:hypothetical protein [Bacilli bacterium]